MTMYHEQDGEPGRDRGSINLDHATNIDWATDGAALELTDGGVFYLCLTDAQRLATLVGFTTPLNLLSGTLHDLCEQQSTRRFPVTPALQWWTGVALGVAVALLTLALWYGWRSYTVTKPAPVAETHHQLEASLNCADMPVNEGEGGWVMFKLEHLVRGGTLRIVPVEGNGACRIEIWHDSAPAGEKLPGVSSGPLGGNSEGQAVGIRVDGLKAAVKGATR